jgi:hypothetical protein
MVMAISIGTSLLAGYVSVFFAMRTRKGAAVNRDIAVPVLLGVAVLLTLLIVIAAAPIAVSGMACVIPLKIALLLTAVFAALGTVFGLVRGLRSARAGRPRRA